VVFKKSVWSEDAPRAEIGRQIRWVKQQWSNFSSKKRGLSFIALGVILSRDNTSRTKNK
jgi:hypothetical protein